MGNSRSHEITPADLARKIRKLEAWLPLTDEFNPVSDRCQLSRPWYKTQKQHWIGWLSEYSGPGAHGATNRKYLGEYAYNRIVCPYMLLWLAEASGVPKAKVVAAKRSAEFAGSYFAAQSAAIRKIIPWQMIHSLLFN